MSGVDVASDDEVDVGGACGPRPRARGGRPASARSLVDSPVGGDVALADAGARDDPLVAGLDQRLEVVVGEHLAREGSRRCR